MSKNRSVGQKLNNLQKYNPSNELCQFLEKILAILARSRQFDNTVDHRRKRKTNVSRKRNKICDLEMSEFLSKLKVEIVKYLIKCFTWTMKE